MLRVLSCLLTGEGEAMKPTGWCWACGLQCGREKLFCDKKCENKYLRGKARIFKREVRIGKKAGYGLAGSTH